MLLSIATGRRDAAGLGNGGELDAGGEGDSSGRASDTREHAGDGTTATAEHGAVRRSRGEAMKEKKDEEGGELRQKSARRRDKMAYRRSPEDVRSAQLPAGSGALDLMGLSISEDRIIAVPLRSLTFLLSTPPSAPLLFFSSSSHN
jgi:hypothetical protein